MRRAVVLGVLGALVLAAAGVVIASPSPGESDYRVDVVFDDSRGLVPGQLVQAAGARIGTIDEVSLTRDYKARVHLKVDGRFGPFRKDATCTIKPQGLIAENYVECDPGSPDAPALKRRGDTAPTVPVERSTQPVAITDLFEIWNAPVRDRLQILLNTLGIATAARGEDLNAALRRANPTLTLARRTIATLERQRGELATIVDATGEVAEGLAERPRELTRLVRRAARVTTETATQRAALGESVRRLPGLLRQARPALRQLDATMAAGEPLLEQLSDAAPAVNRVSAGIPRLERAAIPALKAMAPVLRAGARTARRSAPFLQLVQEYAAQALPSSRTAGALFTTLEDRGFPKTFLEFLYNGAVASARYDGSGHLLPAHVTLSMCGIWATTPLKGCGSAFPSSTEDPAKQRGARDREDEDREPAERQVEAPAREPAPDAVAQDAAPTETPEAAAPAPPAPETAAPAPAPTVPQTPQPPGEAPDNVVTDLLDFLLG